MFYRSTLIVLVAGTALLAQDQVKPTKTPPVATTVTPSVAEDVATIKAVPYNPTIKRDPFSAPRDERPVDALDVLDDIAVKGMIKKEGKNFAIVSDSRGLVRWLPVGHRFKDGEITDISDKDVTFHQWELNTTNRSVFRTVKKSFKREEGKR